MLAGRPTLVVVVLGGMVGVLLRAATAQLLPVHPGTFPWATLLVNVVGCFLLGVVATRHEHYGAAPHWRPLLGTGLAGGLTTFSTLQVELLNLLDDGDAGLAVAYVAASLGLGLGAVVLATAVTHRRGGGPGGGGAGGDGGGAGGGGAGGGGGAARGGAAAAGGSTGAARSGVAAAGGSTGAARSGVAAAGGGGERVA